LKKYETEKLGPAKAEEEMKRIEKKLAIEAEEQKEEEKEQYKTVSVDIPQPEVLKVMEASSLFNIAAKKKKGDFNSSEFG
jgi:hypothetical protein